MTDIETDETATLIASNKVEGTAVFNRQRERLGAVYNFMVDKKSGKVDYAVLSFGGFLGVGADYYPLPWKLLSYDTGLGGYVVDLDRSLLDNAPRYARDEEPRYDQAYGERVFGHYGMAYPG